MHDEGIVKLIYGKIVRSTFDDDQQSYRAITSLSLSLSTINQLSLAFQNKKQHVRQTKTKNERIIIEGTWFKFVAIPNYHRLMLPSRRLLQSTVHDCVFVDGSTSKARAPLVIHEMEAVQ